MDATIDGTPFSVLMEQAASLKTAQLASARTKYDSFDVWYQHSLYSRQDVIQIRNTADFNEMITFASDCKQLGNASYEREEYSEAIHQYERALSVFKWIEPLDPDWKSKGISDETQRECVYQCKSEPEDLAIIAVNPDNAKAYYRRAQAKLIPKSTGMIEHMEALKDLQMASTLQPNNASIKKEYLDLKQGLKMQAERDKKTFNNLFDRVDYASADDAKGNCNGSDASSSAASSAGTAPPLTYAEVLTTLKDLESAALSYERDGNKQAARETRRRITTLQGLLEQAKKEQQQQQQQGKVAVDYSAPSEKMLEEARAMGLDLKDERVRKLMMEMERLRVQGSNNSGTTGGAVDPTQLYAEAVRSLHLEESKQLAEKVLEGLNREQLIDMLVCRSTFTFHANNSSGSSGRGGADVSAVIQSVSNVIGAYSPAKLYAELSDLIVQDVMQVKSANSSGGSDESSSDVDDDSRRTNDEIMSLLEVRYFCSKRTAGGKNRSSSSNRGGRLSAWLRSPLGVGILAGLLFIVINIFFKTKGPTN